MERYELGQVVPSDLGRNSGYLVEPHIKDEEDGRTVSDLATKMGAIAYFSYDPTNTLAPSIDHDFYLFKNLRKTLEFRRDLLKEERLVLCTKTKRTEEGLWELDNLTNTEKRLIYTFDSNHQHMTGADF